MQSQMKIIQAFDPALCCSTLERSGAEALADSGQWGSSPGKTLFESHRIRAGPELVKWPSRLCCASELHEIDAVASRHARR